MAIYYRDASEFKLRRISNDLQHLLRCTNLFLITDRRTNAPSASQTPPVAINSAFAPVRAK